MGIVGYLWSDASFYILAGVNGIALAVWAWSFSNKEKKDIETKVSEKILANNKVEKSLEIKEEPLTALIEEETEDQEEKEEKKSDFFVREVSDKDERYDLEEDIPSPQAEKKPHNIEQVRVRFNRSKSKTQATQQEGGLARFIAFLCAIVGRGGVMLLMWQEFDFIAMAIASFLMGLFILVVFKAMNIWKKSIFSSLYFLLFVLLFAGSIAGIFIDEHNSTKVLIKDQLSTFFAGLNGDIIEKQGNNELSGYEYQLTGALLTGENLSGTERTGELLTGIVNTGVNLTSGTTPTKIAQPTTPQTADTQTQPTRTPSTTTQQTIQTPIHQQEKKPVQEIQKTQTPAVHTQTNPDANGQVSYLSAIKHLIATYNIPLSKSTTSKFTYVAQNSPEYPYMKTALEKRMIGTATNPNDTISCDVYMVFKGIALNWAIEKTSNLKNDYRNVAENKWLLNGCVKGAKLTVANL